MLKTTLLVFAFAAVANADLRMASQPKREWKTQQRNRNVAFKTNFNLYMEPSDFNYAGLKQQRDGGAYDNFLRSNIDNEQDRRNFNTEAGEDHLPFRSYATAATDASTTVKHKMVTASKESILAGDTAGDYIYAVPGEPYNMALRWNNPHSSELEVNIWIMNKGEQKYVIPIRKPACSGEGYQDNAFTFTVPSNFNDVASCRAVGECILQIYAHSVESRMYAMGTPLIVENGSGKWNPGAIKEAEKDRGFAFGQLRRLCLPSSDEEAANHPTAVVYKARLMSDVYNHAYQNSDFSPYAGQQPQHISQNLQASAILKMTVGNFGELGKQYMQKTAPEARQYANKLDKKARQLIRVYETQTNAIIEAIKYNAQNNDTMEAKALSAGAVPCTEWRDQYDRRDGGRKRGKDRTGGYCPAEYTCLCHGDCYLGYGPGDKQRDAYCAKMEPKEAGSKLMKEVANSEIGRITGPQESETCFRCAEVGSTKVKRQNTNTYIPSFEILGSDAVNMARDYVAPIYLKSGFLTNPVTGAITAKDEERAIVQIYMAVLTEMWDEFKSVSDGSYMMKHYKNKYDKLPEPKAESLKKYQFHYRGPVLKTTTATLSDANGGVDQKFKKLNAEGKQDKGYYSAAKAWSRQALETGSSFAVPNTDGPLDGTIPKSTNMAGNKDQRGGTGKPAEPSGGDNIKYKLPPPEAASDSCDYATPGIVMSTEITEEGIDMDGLDRDADCDDDELVRVAQAKFDAACLAENEKNPAYECPGYPDDLVVCHIKGANDKLPTQMFSNNEDDDTGLGAASGLLPSMGLVAALLLPSLL